MKVPDAEAGHGRAGRSALFLGMAVLLSIGGLAAFVYLFVLDFNVYWLILSPIILALYQLPATFFYWLHKRARRRAGGPVERPDGPGDTSPRGPSGESRPAG